MPEMHVRGTREQFKLLYRQMADIPLVRLAKLLLRVRYEAGSMIFILLIKKGSLWIIQLLLIHQGPITGR